MSTPSSPPTALPDKNTAALLADPNLTGITPPGNPAAEIQAWIQTINGDLGYSVGWAVQAGSHLLEAKQRLGHGRWLTLFGVGKLAFGVRKGQVLMEIARHPSLRKAQNFAHLPAAWSTLHALSKLRPEKLDAMIADGTIHPQLKLEAAQRLAIPYSPAPAAGGTAGREGSFDAVTRQEHILTYLRREAKAWPPHALPQLAQRLQEFAAGLLSTPAPAATGSAAQYDHAPESSAGLAHPDFTKRSHGRADRQLETQAVAGKS